LKKVNIQCIAEGLLASNNI